MTIEVSRYLMEMSSDYVAIKLFNVLSNEIKNSKSIKKIKLKC